MTQIALAGAAKCLSQASRVVKAARPLTRAGLPICEQAQLHFINNKIKTVQGFWKAAKVEGVIHVAAVAAIVIVLNDC